MVGVLLSITVAMGLANALLTLLMWLDIREAKARAVAPLFDPPKDPAPPAGDTISSYMKAMSDYYKTTTPMTTTKISTKTISPAKAKAAKAAVAKKIEQAKKGKLKRVIL